MLLSSRLSRIFLAVFYELEVIARYETLKSIIRALLTESPSDEKSAA